MRRVLPLLLLCMFVLAGAPVAFSATSVETEIAVSGAEVTIAPIGEYHAVTLGPSGSTSEIGKPMLPERTVWVAIPAGHVAESVAAVSIVAVDLPGSYRVYPLQTPRETSPSGDGEQIPFVEPDPAVYASDQIYPAQLAELAGQSDLAGQQLAAIKVHPVRWDPAGGILTVHEKIRLTVICRPGHPPAEQRHKLSFSVRRLYQDMLAGMVLNPEQIDIPAPAAPAAKALGSGDYDHVVITDSSWKVNFQPLVQWHFKKGVRDTLVSLQWIYANYGGSDLEKVRSFIQEANSTWGTLWFLLGGDTEVVPIGYGTFNSENVAGDLYYADYDGDWISEVFVGRAPVDDPAQVNTFVNKVLQYEQDPALSDFALDCLLVGMDLDASTPTENLKEIIDAAYIPGRFNVTKVYDSDPDSHWVEAMSALNGGQNLVNHSDHSYISVMGVGDRNHGTYIDIGDVNALSNTGQASVIYSLGCHPAHIDYYDYDCIAEYFVAYNPGQAGVAYTGNTRSGIYYVGNMYGLSLGLDMEWWNSLFTYNRYRVGQTLADSRNRNYPDGETLQYLHWGLVLLGDPEMPIWTDDPAVPAVTHPTIYTTGSPEFPVHVEADGQDADGALVCLWKGDEVYMRDLTDIDGDVTFHPFPATVGTLWVTVTHQNMLPYEGSAEIILFSPPDPVWTGQVDQAYAMYGWSLDGIGDVNGDGYGDVAVGDPLYSDGQDYEGVVFVYHGDAAGLPATPSWTGQIDSAYAYLGGSIAWAGDVDGDGYSDLAVGVEGFSSGQTEEGAALVYLGGSSGLAATPAWMVESDHAGAHLGFSVSSAGDVNGDGYSDLIVGSPYYDTSGQDEGRADVYLGGSAGPSITADWSSLGDRNDAYFGSSVASAGDVNGDGYSDVVVGASSYTDLEPMEGAAFLYHGGPSGLPGTPDWNAVGGEDYANFGSSVASAGDVNGDGYSDVIIGAPGYTDTFAGEGRVFLYLGTASGLPSAPDVVLDGGQTDAEFGYSVSGAGDVNGDGCADVVVGAESYSDGQEYEGCVLLYLGSAIAPYLVPAWRAQRDQAGAYFGNSVAGAGDVDADGYDDILAGAWLYDGGQQDEGQAYLFAGDQGAGLPFRPRQVRADGSALVGPLGSSGSETQVRLRATGWYPGGSEYVKLQWEIKALGSNFNGLGLEESAGWSLADSAAGVELDETAGGLTENTAYHWRTRILYQEGNPLGLDHSVWLSPAHNGWNEADFRTSGSGGGPPLAVDDLQITLISGTKSSGGDIWLTWSEPFSEAGLSHYVIYRSSAPADTGDSLATTSLTEYTDSGVVGDPAGNHYYSIKAVDVQGKHSAISNQVGEFDIDLMVE